MSLQGNSEFIGLSQLESQARSVLDADTFAYISSSAGDTLEGNEMAWKRLRLRPRMLRDVSEILTATDLLGQPSAVPIVIAPTAMHRLVCPEAELATACAASDADVIYVVSMSASTAIQDVAVAAPAGTQWMQAYVRRDRGLTRATLECAAAAGCSAVVLTVDSPGSGASRVMSGAFLNKGLPLPNMMSVNDDPDVLTVAADYADDLTFDDLTDIRSWTGLPLVVKGVLRGDDAIRCVAAGADAIVVSNHGGRKVQGSISTAAALSEVVDAVSGSAEVYVDGSIRSGSDVLKALALGAKAVFVGRPILWGLAIGGERTAYAVLRELRAQLQQTMALCGVCDVATVPRDLIRTI